MLRHMAPRQVEPCVRKSSPDLGPNLVREPLDALKVGCPIHGPQMKHCTGTFLHRAVWPCLHIQSKGKGNDAVVQVFVVAGNGLSNPGRVTLRDGRDGVHGLEGLDFFMFQLALKQVEQPLLGATLHALGHFLPKLMLHVVGPQDNFSVAESADGRDVRRGEERLQQDDVVEVGTKGVFDGHFHFRHVKATQVVALARHHMAHRVAHVQLRVGEDRLELGLGEVIRGKGRRHKGVLVGVKRQHLEGVSLFEQSRGQAVHGDAPSIHRGARGLVADLKNA